MKAKVCIGKLLLIAIALCLHFSGMTQGFNYQAVVRDATGAAIANRSIKIRITLQNTQGTQFFSENKALTTSAQGVINHVVGSGTITLGTLAGVPWDSGDIKIKVDIDPTGGTNYTLLGNPTLIQPVPYALYAESGTQGPAGQDGLSIDWLGNLFNAPNAPTKNQTYYNLNDKIAYIYNGTGWDILAKDGTNGIDGTDGIDGVSINWLGNFDNPPAGSKNKAYYNNTDKKSYIHDGTGWVIMTIDGKDGKDGTNGTNGTNGLSIHWLGNLSSQPTGTLNDAYYNTGDKKSYIFNGLSWDQLTQDGTDGVDGTSIQWLGDLGAHPTSALNNAYYNINDKKSYIYDGANWVTLAKDGVKGDPGPGLINKGTWVANTPYVSGNYVFHRSTASSSVNSMYICQVDVTSATEPYLDGTHWVELQSIKGDKGDTGTPGTNGISIQWLGIASSNPVNPLVNQAFYHTGQKKSLIYNGSVWQTMAIDGSNGINGISINWLGPLGAYPGSPSLNSAFYHTGDKKSYIWNGAGWNILAVDGTNGINGTNGSNGTNGISIQWLGNLSSIPQTPSLNQAYYHTGDKKSYIYNGSSWSILAQDGMPISGTPGQTLYYNGAWTPTSTITNDGTNVGIGISPTSKLDINGGIRLRSALYDNTTASLNPGTTDQILTSTGTGILWKSPSGIGGVATGTGTAGQLALWSDNNSLNGITNLSWGTSLQVASNPTAGPDDPIFEVKNKDGKVVFGVYQGGVRVYVEDSPTVKGARGGFAVGGLSQTKGTEEYLRITPDSARIYIDDTPIVKGARGGFAVGGLSQTKASTQEYLRITPDSARVYVNNSPTKGARGGFAVGGLSQTKTTPSNFMALTPNNYFIGHEAGKANTLGLYNSFIGYQVGKNNTTGQYNSFLGYNVGLSNISGSSNVFIGNESGRNNVLGSSNVFLGFNAGYSTNASYNSFIGYQSGKTNTSGQYNTFMGYNSGLTNSTGNNNTFLGNEAGLQNTIGDYNVFIGHQSGYTDTASYNTYIGYKTGYNNQSGRFNVYLGYESGWYSGNGTTSDPSYNTFIGYQAGKYNQTGQYNTFMGYQAGLSSSTIYGTGKNNVAIGYKAGLSLTIGENNVFIGTEAGRNTTGIAVDTVRGENTFVGKWAGRNNTTGYQNIAVGYYAGKGLTTNNRNTLVGNNAGEVLATGIANSYFGTYAGREATSGNNNTIIGYDAGYQNRTGSCNTFVGFQAGRGWGATVMKDSSVFIGNEAGAYEGTSQKLYISNSSTSNPLIWGDFKLSYATVHGSLGINTKAPGYSIEAYGSNAAIMAHYVNNTRGGICAFPSYRLAMLTTDPSNDLVFGYSTNGTQASLASTFIERMRVDVSTGNVGIGTNAPSQKLEFGGSNAILYLNSSSSNMISFNNQGVAAPTKTTRSVGTKIVLYPGLSSTATDWAIGMESATMWFSVPSSSDYYKFYGGTTEIMRINGNGYVGIGIAAPTHILHINGQGRSTSSSWATTSDIRLKDVKGSYNYGLKEILKLNAIRFNYKKDNPLKLPSDVEHVGIIAQELKEVIPEAVTMNGDGYYTVSTDPIFWSMLNAIKEQQKTIDEQQKKIDKLEQKNAEIDVLKSELEAIKAMLKK